MTQGSEGSLGRVKIGRHYMNTEEYNLALIREWALQKSMQHHRRKQTSLNKILLDAKKIAQWYENKQDASVITLVKK